tara:strand:+ start:199 stop:1170 length:972 start_codon:yes stop_codon:yes gene_type:complete
MSFNKLSICLHFGKKDNYPFLENFIKSFLICNTYPNVDLIITETGGDNQIRKWLKKINLNKNFINFDGSITSIKKNKKTNLKLKLVFHKKIHKGKFWVPYMKSFIDAAYAKDNLTNYFVFFVEDCQFFIKGDLTTILINSLKKIGDESAHIGFCIWTKYRYEKFNNRIKKVLNFNKNFSLFQTEEIKGDIFSIISRKIFKKIGKIRKQRDGEKYRQDSINHLTEKFKKNGIKRFYPSVAPIVTLDNDYHSYFREMIIDETKKNPNYVLCKILTRKKYNSIFTNSVSKIVTAERIYKLNSWSKFLKTRFYLKKKFDRYLKTNNI